MKTMKRFLILLAFLIPQFLGAAQAPKRDFYPLDQKVMEAPLQLVTDMEVIADKLNSFCRDDWDRARAILRFITFRIQYDFLKFTEIQKREEAGKEPEDWSYLQEAMRAIQSNKAICAGYAALYHYLGKEMGLHTKILSGKVKGGYGYDFRDPQELGLHAWIAVEIDGVWWQVDPTWATNYYPQSIDERWALGTEQQFHGTHFALPEGDLSPEKEKELAQWANEPIYYPEWYVSDAAVNICQGTVALKALENIKLHVPWDVEIELLFSPEEGKDALDTQPRYVLQRRENIYYFKWQQVPLESCNVQVKIKRIHGMEEYGSTVMAFFLNMEQAAI